MRGFLGLVRRDVLLAFRQGGEVGLAISFFVLAVVLFPFGVGPEPEVLRRIGAGIIWVAALLAAVSSLDGLFAADHADGGLDLMALSPLPLESVFAAKCIAHWLTTGLPLTVISPLLAIVVNLDPDGILILFLGLLIGTPALSLLGAVEAGIAGANARPHLLLLAALSLAALPLAPLATAAALRQALD